MAQFRSNHANNGSGKGNKRGLPFLVKMTIYGIVLLFFLWKLLGYFKTMDFTSETNTTPVAWKDSIENGRDISELESNLLTIDLPSQSQNSSLIQHQFYTLSYVEPHEQAEWVAYTLSREQLNKPKVPRVDYFAPDLEVKTRSALHRDYTGSGYTRGHLAPTADMSFDQNAAEESFLMSNISPQEKYFNQGIWRELEENVRDWARRNKNLLVVTGPVLKSGIIKKIGDNRVSVPSLFFKVLLDTAGADKKGIGFIIPNKPSGQELGYYMVSIDSVETITGINFFNEKSKNAKIEFLEQSIDKGEWPIDAGRYRRRVEEWNKN